MAAHDIEHCEWYAVQVWSGREMSAASQLRLRHSEVFLPLYRAHRRWSDRVKTLDRALFPGYLFCRLDDAAVSRVLTSPGVIRIVGDGTKPIPLPAPEVESIQRIVEARLTVEPWEWLQAGDRVRIDAGPLRGAEGVIVTVKNRLRLVVSVALLQRALAVELPIEWVSAPNAMLLDPRCRRHAS